MSRSAWLLLTLICLVFGCPSRPPAQSATQLKPLHLAARRWPPWTDTSQREHLAIDLVDRALERAGYRARVQIVASDTLQEALKLGSFDGSPAMWRGVDREQYLLFSDAYLENRLVLIALKETPLTATSFTELAGKTIAIIESYSYGPELEQATGPTFLDVAAHEQGIRALLHGEVDYVLADFRVAVEKVKAAAPDVRERLAVGHNVMLTRTLHFTMRKDRPDAQQVLDAFNRQLPSMLADGSYHAALHTSWIRADVDGDGRYELVFGGDAAGAHEPSATDWIPTVPSRAPSAEMSPTSLAQLPARLVVKGKFYDSWAAALAAQGH